MSFITDKQTLEDLNLLGKYRPNSILSIFNQAKTRGGERLLENMFNQPLSDPMAINERVGVFQYFRSAGFSFPFADDQIRQVEGFLGMDTGVNSFITVAKRKIQQRLLRDEQYELLYEGLMATTGFLRQLNEWLPGLDKADNPFLKQVKQILSLLSDRRLTSIIQMEGNFSTLQTAKYTHFLKRRFSHEMESMMEILYELDVYIAVAGLAERKGYGFARAHAKDRHFFHAAALWHPGVDKAVANPIRLDQDHNMLFLTGANMAGKSTFMKSFGIAVYLAHMGFPVAAQQLEFSVRQGLYSSINVGDNLAQGYSHFYAEVLRVKQVAQEVSAGKDLVVIFDELFKGTNVKDAYDATLAVTRLLAAYRNCLYIVSTHIIEVGETLREHAGNVRFAFLPTIMEGNIPRYPYSMKEGITTDKHGMMIISNEGILEILKHV